MTHFRRNAISLTALLLAGSSMACPKPTDPKLVAEAHYHKGMEHRLNGDLEAALLEFQEAIRGDASLVRAHHSMGDTWNAMKNYPGASEAAEAAFRKAIELEPEKGASWLGLGHALRQQRRYDAAVEAYEKSAALDSENPAPHRFLGDLYAAALEVDRAVAAYRDAARLSKPEEGIEPLERLANLFEKKGRNLEASEAYAAVVDAATAADEQRAQRLKLLQQNGSEAEIRQLARAVAEAGTVHSIRLTRLGDLRAMAGNLEGALEAYRAGISLSPEHAPLWELVGTVQLVQKEFGAARASFGRARELAPTSVSAPVGLAELELAAGRLEEAKKALQTAVATITGAEDDLLLSRVAALFGATGEHQKAVVMYENLVASVKDDPALWVALADEQKAVGEPEAAAFSCGQARKQMAKRDPKILGDCAL